MTIAIHQIETAVAVSKKLIAFYNANTGGAQVKKFSDRDTAERRCVKLAQELEAEGVLSSELFLAIANGTEAVAGYNPDQLNGFQAREAAKEAAVESVTGVTEVLKGSSEHLTQERACPGCGGTQDITAGRIVIRAGHQVLIDEDVFTCHPCGHEWGTPDAPAKKSVSTGLTRPEMAKSLKLDRAIQEVTTGHIYANACQVWKAGLVSSAQCDRLSATLYGAAKAGNRLMSVTVNGHVFTLANRV